MARRQSPKKAANYIKRIFRSAGSSTPYMDSISDDILLRILTYLPYWDLKIYLPLVCRRFHNLINSSKIESRALDRKLFRDDVIGSQSLCDIRIRDSRIFFLHPAFRQIFYRGGALRDVMLSLEPGVHTTRTPDRGRKSKIDQRDPRVYVHLTKSPVAEENAVSPAVTGLNFILPGVDKSWMVTVTAAEPGGSVTVLDVMKAVVKFYATEWDDPMLRVRCTHGKSLEMKGKTWRFGRNFIVGRWIMEA